MTLFNQDVFLNVAGGIRLSEPGIDLGIATSIVSSKLEKPVPAHTVVCGEIGLAGEVRAVSQIGQRIREAERLGFRHFIAPVKSLKGVAGSSGMQLIGVASVGEAVDRIFKL